MRVTWRGGKLLGPPVVGVATILAAAIATAAATAPLESERDWIIGFIRDIGFPIFVALYVLVRLETSVNRLTKVIEALLGHLKGP
jgi:hypothetical protein